MAHAEGIEPIRMASQLEATDNEVLDQKMLPGKRVNQTTCPKRLQRPTMTSVHAKSCRVLALNPWRTFSDIRDAFMDVNYVIIMVGKTGTGKTSLIDTVTNLFLGVQFGDPYRYTLKEDAEIGAQNQTTSQTKQITVYIMQNDKMRLAVIDTPGFADTDGETDKKIPTMVKNVVDEAGHPDINGICFVVKGAENRIGKQEEDVFKGVLNLFPKTAKLSTFACYTHWSDESVPENASKAFSVGVFGKSDVKNHVELCFENAKAMYGTNDGELISTSAKWIRRAEEDYEYNVESFNRLIKEIPGNKFASKDMANVITSRQRAAEKYVDMNLCLRRTCEKMIDLFREKKTREELRESILKEREKLEEMNRKHEQFILNQRENLKKKRKQWELEQKARIDKKRREWEQAQLRNQLAQQQWEENRREWERNEQNRFEREQREWTRREEDRSERERIQYNSENVEREREIQAIIKEKEKKLLETKNVYCDECQQECCTDCLFEAVDDCDLMEYQEVSVREEFKKGFVSGIIAIGRKAWHMATSPPKICKECNDSPEKHAFKKPEVNINDIRRKAESSIPKPVYPRSTARSIQGPRTYDRPKPLLLVGPKPENLVDLEDCPIPDPADIPMQEFPTLPDPESAPSPQETEERIHHELQCAKRELLENVEQFRRFLEFLEKTAWRQPEMNMDSCKNELSTLLKVRYSSHPEAYAKCKALLEEAFVEC